MTKEEEKINNDAEKISSILISTDTNLRGLLLLEISQNLYRKSQGYTGRLFQDIASIYGFADGAINDKKN